jgi:translation elongation factor EF-G
MIENAVEQDDAAMEAYLEGEEPDVATLRKLIRKGTLASASCRFSAARRSRTRVCSRC